MSSRSVLAATCALVVVGGSLASSSLAQTPLPSAGPTHITGRTEAALCSINILYPSGNPNSAAEAPCLNAQGSIPFDGWKIDMHPESSSWQFDDKRHVEFPIPGFASAILDAEAHNTFAASIDASGGFQSETIRVDITAAAGAAADSLVTQRWVAEFDTNAASIKVSGKAAKTLRTVPADVNGLSFSEGQFAVRVNCSIANGQIVKGLPPTDLNADIEVPLDAELTLDGSLRHCQIEVIATAFAAVETNNVDGPDPARSGFSHVTADVTITAEGAACDLEGTVYDGDEVFDEHANPVPYVTLVLSKDGQVVGAGQPIDPGAVTGPDGRYCLHGITPDDYTVELILEDRLSQRLETHHGDLSPGSSSTNPGGNVAIEYTIAKSDFEGDSDLDFDFASDADDPWLPDAAEVHRNVGRMIIWMLNNSVVLADEWDGPLKVVIDDQSVKSSEYGAGIVRLTPDDSRHASRRLALSNCPENCEWHETAHFVADTLNIANDRTGVCQDDRPALGWPDNPTTCASLAEGFAIFLATAASIDLDAVTGGGYGTSHYAGLDDLESNFYKPSDSVKGVAMEAFAVAELLWDLADDTPTEPFSPIVYKGPLDRLAQLLVEDLAVVSAKDQINLGAPGVVRLLFSDKAQTVADAYDILKATDNLAATLRQPSLDLNGDGTADISALDSVFLAHGFHAMRSGSEWIYRVGDPFGETTYGSGDGNLDTPRRAFAPPPGAAIRLNNPSAAAVTFTLRIDNGTTSQEFEVDVAPTSSLTLALLLPPYSRALAQAGAELPACGADDEQRVTLTVSGGGIADRTIDNCEYLHAVAAAPADVALAFGDELPSPTANDGLPGPTPTPTPTAQAPGQAADSTPLLIGGIILLAAVAGLAGWLILRRRK